jgi:hypothetical protein
MPGVVRGGRRPAGFAIGVRRLRGERGATGLAESYDLTEGTQSDRGLVTVNTHLRN